MGSQNLVELLKRHPIIAAVHSRAEAELAIRSSSKVVFVLGGRLFEIAETVQMLKKAGKEVFVHLDLVEGLAKDASAVQIMAEIVHPDGLLTTKNNLVRVIRDHGMLAGLRCFVMDGQSYHKAVQVCGNISPDFVELMPGVLPSELVRSFCADIGTLVVASGLVRSAVDANRAFAAGARGISTSEQALWNLPEVAD